MPDRFRWLELLVDSVLELWREIAAIFGSVAAIYPPIRKWIISRILAALRIARAIIDSPRVLADVRALFEEIEDKMQVLDFTRKTSVQSLHLPAFECDSSGRYSLVSKAYCDLLGVAESRLSGGNWTAFVEQDSRALIIRDFLAASQSSPPSEFRRVALYYDASARCVGQWLIVALPVTSRDGSRVLGYSGRLHPYDATAKKIAERLNPCKCATKKTA